MDTKAIRQKWAKSLATTNSQEFAVNPAELAAVVAEGTPSDLSLPESRTGCTHILVPRAALQSISGHEQHTAEAVSTNIHGQFEADVDD